MTIKQEAKQMIGTFLEMGMDRPTAVKASVFMAEKLKAESSTFDKMVHWKSILKELNNEASTPSS
jgi:hypothetical protein